jgi:tRNA-specific 2-thiouridylase
LKRSIFPLGELTKDTVRALAKQANLVNFAKKDSTGICFIGERNFKRFLSEYLLAKPGDIVTTDQQVIGRHDGLMFYTLGQRKGLKIGGLKNVKECPWYVAAKDFTANQLIVTQEHDHALLLKGSLICHSVNWVSECEPKFPLDCYAKTRYRQPDQPCNIIELSDGQFKVNFAKMQRAITPGQSVVCYQGDYCLGGGVII